MTADVDIQAFQAPPVRVVATGHPTNRAPVDGTFEGSFTAESDEGAGAFEADTTSHAIVSVDGGTAWDRTVRHCEECGPRVGEDGNVTTEGHAVT
ncbi:hypothetical protein DP107_02440 [Haloglomus irregulare]|jgi:hypothetical protein|uniref:Uncharacterized protein n=1 Tax=Haloglomus irregulare TaxID=2234134 RepID=A0A554NF83_9EURY|nr:hypothetical protein [Haloglomus irregulare]TSD16057.1 hypothetical protein DP107_02440 [Haloglomus irregulare]